MLGSADVGVAHEFLDIIKLVASLFEPMSEGSAQGMCGSAFGDTSGTDGGSDGFLNAAGVEVVPFDDKGAGVYGEVTGGEDVLPSPGGICSRVFAGQGGRHGDRYIGMGLVEAAHLVEVGMEALEELLVVRQESHTVAVRFCVADGDEVVLKVQVLDAQAQGFYQPQAASVEEAGDEVRCAVKLGKDAEAFVMAEVGLEVGAPFRAQGVHIAERDTEDFLVEED